YTVPDKFRNGLKSRFLLFSELNRSYNRKGTVTMESYSSRSYGSGISLLLLLVISQLVFGDSSDAEPETYSSSIHPDAEIFNSSYPQDFGFSVITGLEATVFADSFLSYKGADNVVFCRATWIAAPLGGYLIDGLCEINIKGIHYTSFRIGIGDGSGCSPEEDTFTFIAHGSTDENGNILWYPEPGPDLQPGEYEIVPESYFNYEFLLNREDFENLESDFPR
ncbi:MAG: hypothetical protein K8S15_02995, partial [Candidatus Aegiribacteria sp.]|nr:hypothetical protein [Candidatus Aegiribacteria sp.]